MFALCLFVVDVSLVFLWVAQVAKLDEKLGFAMSSGVSHHDRVRVENDARVLTHSSR